jgi:hypothetical protein
MNYYINFREYYVDFPYLMGVTQLTRSRLHYILNDENIGKIRYKDSYLYKLEDLQRSPNLGKFMETNIVDVSFEWDSKDSEM